MQVDVTLTTVKILVIPLIIVKEADCKSRQLSFLKRSWAIIGHFGQFESYLASEAFSTSLSSSVRAFVASEVTAFPSS